MSALEEEDNSMMALNKDQLLKVQDATFDYEKKLSVNGSGRKSMLKKQEVTEKELLEKIARKLKEE